MRRASWKWILTPYPRLTSFVCMSIISSPLESQQDQAASLIHIYHCIMSVCLDAAKAPSSGPVADGTSGASRPRRPRRPRSPPPPAPRPSARGTWPSAAARSFPAAWRPPSSGSHGTTVSTRSHNKAGKSEFSGCKHV